jgi:large subunit ribosomal protein L3
MYKIMFKKIGMTRLFDQDHNVVPITVLQLEKTLFVGSKTIEKDGYEALILSKGEQKKNKPALGQDKKYDKNLGKLYETSHNDIIKNETINVENFVKTCDYLMVNVIGITKGHGFTGVMKRHNFKGQGASHGNSLAHRSGGSTGMRTEPGRTIKNTKMAGHYGSEQVTIKNLVVFGFDNAKQCIFIKGSVPGPNKSDIYISPVSLKMRKNGIPKVKKKGGLYVIN